MIRIEKNSIKRLATGAISLLVALAVWLIVSLIVNSEFLFPSPALVFKEVGVYLVTPVFYAALFSTLIKILVSFFIALVAAVALAFLSAKVKTAEYALYPFVVIARAAPTVSVVFICLLWFSSRVSPMIVAFLVIFPVLYSSALTGIRGVDSKLVEMASAFKVKRADVIKKLYLPSLFSRLYSDSVSTLSLNVKLVIAAESWAYQVNNNLGTLITQVKTDLETAKLFAVTVLAILLSFALELLLRLIRAVIIKTIERSRLCRSL